MRTSHGAFLELVDGKWDATAGPNVAVCGVHLLALGHSADVFANPRKRIALDKIERTASVDKPSPIRDGGVFAYMPRLIDWP